MMTQAKVRGFYICIALALSFVTCSKDTLFDANGHAFSHPFAFVSHTAHNSPLLSDSIGLEIIDTAPKGADVYFIGLVSHSQQKVNSSWNFGDGQAEDTASMVKHAFSRTGAYHAYYSILDPDGDFLSDSATVRVVSVPVVDSLYVPQSGETGIDPAAPGGLLFAWHKAPSDSGETVVSYLLLGPNSYALDTIGMKIKGQSYTLMDTLLPATTYYWRVVLKSNFGQINSSAIDSFTTSNPALISKPTIVATLPDTTVKAMDTLHFYVYATDSGSVITDYAWDWNGDGTYDTNGVTLDSCRHVYKTEGTYRPVVRVTDQNGKTANSMIRIIVTPIIPTDKPVIRSISRDTTIKLLDSMLLYANVTDATDTITEYAWDFNGDGVFDTLDVHADSCVHRFTIEGAFNVVFRATDKHGLFAQDTVRIIVKKEKLLLNFSSHDTIVDYSGTVMCLIGVNNSTSNLSFAVDTGHNGVYMPMNQSGQSASYSFSTGSASSWDSVRMRVTSPSSDTIVTGFKVDIRPRKLTITTVDSTDSTITLHWDQSLEPDFQEYKLYRNTTSSVDSTSELVDTITQASTTSYTVHVPNFVQMPRYYRLYQKDNEGVASAGSNVVFGNIKSSQTSQPLIVTPAGDGDSMLSNATIRWLRSIDPRGDTVTYDLHVTAGNAGRSDSVIGMSDTFFALKNIDTLSFLANIQVIASNKKGVSSSSERLNIKVKKVASGIMRRVVAGSIIDDQGSTAFIRHDFFMDSIEVTQSAFRNVMSTIPTELFNGDQLPVQNVTWFDAIMYCNALSKQANLDTVYTYGPITSIGAYGLAIDSSKNGYRLPTEDEWELAAKGGKGLIFATDDGSIPCSKANYSGCKNSTVKVGNYPANPFGLHDLSGNISEWCWNRYVPNDTGRVNGRLDYQGPNGTSIQRIVRGGSYADNTTFLMTNYRAFANSYPRYNLNELVDIGFRCVRLAP
jgi:hypothetical protein